MGKRDIYVEKLKTQLDKWNADIDKLETKIREYEVSARQQYETELIELREKRNEARARLTELQEASEDAWEDLLHGFERSWDILRESIEHAISRFKV